VLVASSEEELQELVSRVYGVAKDAGMRVNVRKTEVMKICENAPPMRITVNGLLSRRSPRSNTLERGSMPKHYVRKR